MNSNLYLYPIHNNNKLLNVRFLGNKNRMINTSETSKGKSILKAKQIESNVAIKKDQRKEMVGKRVEVTK